MNNNTIVKESIKLLNTGSSDSESASDVHFTLLPPPVQTRRKVRTKRKARQHSGSHSVGGSPSLPCSLSNVFKAGSVSFVFLCVLILGWVVVTLHSQVQDLNNRLSAVSSSYNSETIAELKKALHTLTLNQSFYYDSWRNYSSVVDGVSKQVPLLAASLQKIQDGLKEAPQMLNIGNELDLLKKSLATYEASISDVKLNIQELKEKQVGLQSSLDNLISVFQSNLSSANISLHDHATMIASLREKVDSAAFGPRLANETEEMNAIVERVDGIHTSIMSLWNQQRNNTVTIQYLQEAVSKLHSSKQRP